VPAELIIDGRIATLRGSRGFGWVEAIAVANGRVTAAGTMAEVRSLATSRTTRWHLPDEQVVLPTLTDAHLHLESAAISAQQPDLTGMESRDVGRTIVTAHQDLLRSGNADGWLLGHGWSFAALGKHPDTGLLDAAAPGRPVALWAHDHHARWLSSAAMDAAGLVDRDDPPAGQIERDRDGRPTGLLYEGAAGLVDAVIPVPDDAAVEAAIRSYAGILARLGVTSVHDPGGLAPEPDLRGGPVRYRALAAGGRLPLRVVASVREEQLDRAIEIGFLSGRTVGEPGSGRYRDGWLKLFSDGALGSRTAALLEPYEVDPIAGLPPGGVLGMRLRTPGQLRTIAARAAAAGIASQIHAIGDAAVRTVLDVIAALPRVPGAMHRIEHAQLVDPADLSRFGSLGVAASVQPGHLISDVEVMRRVWGDRSAAAFALASIDASGALLPFGTDAPVEPPDPWPGIAVAVARRGPGTTPQDAFHPGQSLGLDRVFRAACLDGPRSARVDDLGHLGVGAHADLMVLPANVLETPADPDILGTVRPIATMFEGEVSQHTRGFDP
jgi:predicted amidohydrolase YtcJ